MRRTITLLSLCLLWSVAARAVQACPDPATVTQPDGTSLTIYLHGDEFMHFTTTTDGYTVVRDSQLGYVYAQTVDGALTPTQVVAHNPGERTEAEAAYLEEVAKWQKPATSELVAEMRSELKALTARPKLHNYPTYDLSKLKGLVILVEYNDCSFSRDDAAEVFGDMFNQRNYAGVPAYDDSTSITAYTGSVRDYFYHNSMGTYDPEFDVVGPVKIDYSMYDARPDGSTSRTIFRAACKAADDQVDFSAYDSDGDGYCDFVFFVCAGYGSNYSGNDSELLWPHASTLSNLVLDGVYVYRYACDVEMYGWTANNTNILSGIGTICHEFSHVLGVDDLYDTDYDESGGTSQHPGRWSVMASGSYLNYGRTPPSYSLYERYAMGFATPTRIKSKGDYTLESIADTNMGYRIDSEVDGEFFLLENRRKEGWDAYLAGEGMLVFRVDSTDVDVWEENDVNINPDHMYYQMIRGDTANWSSNGLSTDPFPGSGKVTSLTNTTPSNLKSWTGAYTEFIITSISESDDVIYITVEKDDLFKGIEDFESMPQFTADTTDVEGVYTYWDFVSARVTSTTSSAGNEDQAAAIYGGGSIATTQYLSAEAVTAVTLQAWNPGSSAATVHVYALPDSASEWAEVYQSGSTAATALKAGASAVEMSYPLNLNGHAVMLKIAVDCSTSQYCVVDDVEIEFVGTLTSGLSGGGTQNSPYTISTPQEWNDMATIIASQANSLEGMYVKITADLTFSDDTPIIPFGYDRETAFEGYLDGDGHTISGISATSDASYFGGLITEAGSGSYIHDLTVEGTVTSIYTYGAGVVGLLSGGTLENITSRVSVTGTANYTAGLVACASGGTLKGCVNEGSVSSSKPYMAGLIAYCTEACTLDSCANKGTVYYSGSTAACYVAGLVSYLYTGSSLTDCWNEGSVTPWITTSTRYVAGLVAFNYGSDATTFTRCYNTADITAGYSAAGILAGGTTSGQVDMYDCYNTGDITGKNSTSSNSSSYLVAGVSTYYYPSSTYSGCWNSGNVGSSARGYVAGLFTYPAKSLTSSTATTITGCHNTGDVTCGNSYAGGIAARQSSYVTITGCYNTGDVSASTSYCGGISGYLTGSGNSSITDSWNAGAVSADSYAGGIVGYSAAADSISRCFNVGDVTTTSTYAGGLAGYAAAAVTDAYNTGTVMASSIAGGILGAPVASTTTLTNVYSSGNVSASSSYGNILGVSTSITSSWTSGNSLTGSYYLQANAPSDALTDDYSTGLTYAQLAALDMGGAWTAGDNYTYPRLTSIADNDYAIAHAAAVIPAEGDSYSNITADFNVGNPDGVTWTSSSQALMFLENSAYFTDNCSGEVTLTATCGEAAVTTVITCDVSASTGVGDVAGDGREVTDEKFYNAAGVRVAAPDGGQKAIYIVKRTYSDGTVEIAKEAR